LLSLRVIVRETNMVPDPLRGPKVVVVLLVVPMEELQGQTMVSLIPLERCHCQVALVVQLHREVEGAEM